MSAVAKLERAFLPLLQEAERATASEYPEFKFNVGSSSVGGLTEYKGHIVWLECRFPDAADHEADSVAISVGVKHITTDPKLCEASLEWGNGQHPQVTLELLEQPVALTEQSLLEATVRFPELVHAFHRALQAWVGRRYSEA